MFDAEFEIDGVQEILRLLRKLPTEARTKVVERQTRTTANVIRKGAQRRTRSTTVEENIRVRKKRRTPPGVVGFTISVVGDMAHIGTFEEFGTAPHEIELVGPARLADGTVIGPNVIQHPGTDPWPFMRPALDEDGPDAMKRGLAAMARGIEREAAKIAGLKK